MERLQCAMVPTARGKSATDDTLIHTLIRARNTSNTPNIGFERMAMPMLGPGRPTWASDGWTRGPLIAGLGYTWLPNGQTDRQL